MLLKWKLSILLPECLSELSALQSQGLNDASIAQSMLVQFLTLAARSLFI